MRKALFVIIVILAAGITSKGQRPDRPMMDSNEMANRMVTDFSQQVKITPAIQDSLKVVFKCFFEEMSKERESGRRPDMGKMESKRDLKVKSFLNDEQYKGYQSFMEEQKRKRGKPRENGRPERPDRR